MSILCPGTYLSINPLQDPSILIQIHKLASAAFYMMNEGNKEDLLEAIYLLTRQGSSSTSLACLISRLPISCDELESLIIVLLKEGALQRDLRGQMRLTATGTSLAEQVVKKHQILEHFFIEMLGVDPDEASKEACRLEHYISDEVTGRLSALVDKTTGRKEPGGEPLSLPDYKEGDQLIIVQIAHPGRLNRLMDLGFLPGERITVKRKLKNRALVVAVKGCDIALSPDVASLIRVEKTA
jgi:DtxR family Mn-dependent transcriptional regulator